RHLPILGSPSLSRLTMPCIDPVCLGSDRAMHALFLEASVPGFDAISASFRQEHPAVTRRAQAAFDASCQQLIPKGEILVRFRLKGGIDYARVCRGEPRGLVESEPDDGNCPAAKRQTTR